MSIFINMTSQLIAVVEDDVSLQRALQRLLQAAGYQARCFGSAEQLLAARGVAQRAGCLVVDVELPGLSGPACYASLREPRPPVVYITAYDSQAVRKLAPGTEVLLKPFGGDALLRVIERLLARGPPGNG